MVNISAQIHFGNTAFSSRKRWVPCGCKTIDWRRRLGGKGGSLGRRGSRRGGLWRRRGDGERHGCRRGIWLVDGRWECGSECGRHDVRIIGNWIQLNAIAPSFSVVFIVACIVYEIVGESNMFGRVQLINIEELFFFLNVVLISSMLTIRLVRLFTKITDPE